MTAAWIWSGMSWRRGAHEEETHEIAGMDVVTITPFTKTNELDQASNRG
jgi:hypothetical protein